MKYIIAGGRDFNNRSVMFPILSKHINNMCDTIISGDARGADALGAEWATHFQIPIQHFPAQWDKYGKGAGFIRNGEMGAEADALIAFWDGKSKGTAHMIKTMKIQKKPYWVYDYNGNLIEEGTQAIMRIPGNMIQDIQLGDGTDFIKKYGNYDKYEFEILLENKK